MLRRSCFLLVLWLAAGAKAQEGSRIHRRRQHRRNSLDNLGPDVYIGVTPWTDLTGGKLVVPR